MSVPTAGLSILDDAECRALLARSGIGRVIVSIDAMPAAFPVNFRLFRGDIVFGSDAASRLSQAADRNVVGFEVDDINERTRSGWSVQVVGKARVVLRGDELDALEAADVDSWLSTGDVTSYVVIETLRVTGRRLGPAPGDPDVPHRG